MSLGEVYSFVSGLYFRGKLTYAKTFAASPDRVQVITPTLGLVTPETPVRVADLEEFARVDIGAGELAFRSALEATAHELAQRSSAAQIVLLGSIATGKYTDVLIEMFGDRLLFPAEFVGRGDMSRGGLLLRAAAGGIELDYLSVRGAERRGRRPPRLSPPD